MSYHGKGRWVKNQYLSDTKPKSTTSMSSSAVAAAAAVAAYPELHAHRDPRSRPASLLTPSGSIGLVCHRYPQVSSFLGLRSSSGYHGDGRALDCMISSSTVGWDMARWVRSNASSLGVMEVIYRQQIWTVQRSSEGWRPMSDRGSPTANHMDHVHVSVYGNSGTA